MAGTLVNVVAKTTVDFSGIDSAASPLIWLPIGDAIHVVDYQFVGMTVRVHSVAMTGGSISVGIFEDGYLEGSGFAFPGLSIGSISIFPTPAPPYARYTNAEIQGEYLSLGVQGSSSGTGTAAATISVDLFLRNPDET